MRAKRRIRVARFRSCCPSAPTWPSGYPRCWRRSTARTRSTGPVTAASVESLSAEALHLASVLAELLPDEPEVLGLAALLCLSESRRRTRPEYSSTGRFVPLDEQDTALWDRALIDRGEALLQRAHERGRPGRYQLEAAIQSAHCDRARTGRTDWRALRTLHRGLVEIAPSLGRGRGVGGGRRRDRRAASGPWPHSTRSTTRRRDAFQPYWATRAHLLARAGEHSAAADAYSRAIDLTTDTGMSELPCGVPCETPRMIERRRRNELLKKLVAIVALVACLGIGVAIVGSLWTQIFGPRPTTAAQPSVTTRMVASPPENIRPLQVRPVQDVRPPDQCPPEGPPPAVPPTDPVTACDFARTAAYVLGPQAMDIQLTDVETLKSPTSEFYVVRITMSPSSAATFAAYTAQNVGSQVAFIRDGVVVFAPKITQIINSQGLEISGNLTAEQADQVAQLLRKPA